ncbi:MAG: bifunctional hydroxymethylpyrimidine kinase/phosphomethylpyrimidine kinase [Nitrosopumilus sp.]
MNLLSIGGSDPSGGAGIQSDVATFGSHGVHWLTIITAITSQNTLSFGMVEPVSSKILNDQLESVMSDFKIHGIKIGMVYSSHIIKSIHKKLKDSKIPIVIDPVIKSTTGGMLIEKSAIGDFKKLLIPLATIITPNKYEAEIISKKKVNKENTLEEIAKTIQSMGAKNVAITGIKKKKNQISDFIQEKNKKYFIAGKRISQINHGSGCHYSAAMTFALANHKNIQESAQFAKEFTYKSIKNAELWGKGVPITNSQEKDDINLKLTNAINEFLEIKDIHKVIPECQTNFVYSKEKPESIKDILGISGRIVKTGKEVMTAGELTYGGSKHVATAVLTISKKFPRIRSAINIKYQRSTISKIKDAKFIVSSYDRNKEPANTKSNHSTVEWGIKKAISNINLEPDIIYHKGDFGKEPMIIIFGVTPEMILKKILRIF